MQRLAGAVAVLELQFGVQRLVALQGADPAHLRQDHGHRLTLDHGLQVDHGHLGGLADRGAALTLGARLAEQVAHLLQLVRDARPLRGLAVQHRLKPLAFGQQGVAFGAQLDLLKLAQGAQAHVQDRLDLHVVQAELCHHHGLGLVLGPDDLDHAVQVQIGNQIAFQHLQARRDLVQTIGRTAHKNVAAVVQERAQDLLERADLGHAAVDQHVHVQVEPDLQVAGAEQRAHQLFGVDGAGTRFDDDAHVLGGFVAHIGKDRDLARLDQLCQPFDQLGFLHLIGNLGDDDLPQPAAQILLRPARAQAERAAPGAIGLGDAVRRFDQHAAGREIGPLDQGRQRVVARVGRLDQMQAGVHDLVQVVGGDVGCHADRDPRRTVGQQVRKGRGQHDRLAQRAVIVGAEIDRILGQAIHQRLGRRGQAGLGVSRSGRVVAVDVAKVPLPVHQRIAHGEILGQAGHRVIDRGVAMRVIVAHHVAGDLGRLSERPVGRQAQFAHRIEDAAVHRLQPVAGIGQRAVHDRGQRIGQVPLADRAAEGFGRGALFGLGDQIVGHAPWIGPMARPVQIEKLAGNAAVRVALDDQIG